jgi:redox-sensitive bicupin YhaK (pirin superfamily)
MNSIRLITGQRKDLGGFEVARLLPQIGTRSVGHVVFLDHMGPASFPAGAGIDVRPHPHIGLATLTFLFEGSITHRDSLGVVQDIRPGEVNWMTAGRGVVHSERTPEAPRASGSRLDGLQAWIALPLAHEEDAPAFEHYGRDAIPRIERPGVALQLIAGSGYGECSPVRFPGELCYLAGEMTEGASLVLEPEYTERAVYVVSGAIELDHHPLAAGQLAVLPAGRKIILAGRGPARIAILAGAPLDAPRHLWWNFVSSRRERIEQAKADWQAGHFPEVPGESEAIPLPER